MRAARVSRSRIIISGFVTIVAISGKHNERVMRFWLFLMRFGSRIGCHQRPDRSFFFKGYQFPVCARCTGVVIGEIVAVGLLLCGFHIPFYCSVLSILPLAVDGGIQYLHWIESTNFRRIITGLVAGFGLTYAYYYLAVFIYQSVQKWI